MKGGSGVFQQEPFNEAIASEIMRRLNISHISYSLTTGNEKPFSLCENFVEATTELIPAWCVIAALKKINSDSDITHFLRCCDKLGIPDALGGLEKMLALDFIISNEDRHYNNFGFNRNAETLEWIGFAPIFDSGTSLWLNTARIGSKVEFKPFKKAHEEQIKLAANLNWYDSEALKGIEDYIISTFAESEDVDYIRGKAIAKTVLERAHAIYRIFL